MLSLAVLLGVLATSTADFVAVAPQASNGLQQSAVLKAAAGESGLLFVEVAEDVPSRRLSTWLRDTPLQSALSAPSQTMEPAQGEGAALAAALLCDGRLPVRATNDVSLCSPTRPASWTSFGSAAEASSGLQAGSAVALRISDAASARAASAAYEAAGEGVAVVMAGGASIGTVSVHAKVEAAPRALEGVGATAEFNATPDMVTGLLVLLFVMLTVFVGVVCTMNIQTPTRWATKALPPGKNF